MVKNFGAKCRELKIEGSLKKLIKTLFMGTESGARKSFQDRHNSIGKDRRSSSRGYNFSRDRTRSGGHNF